MYKEIVKVSNLRYVSEFEKVHYPNISLEMITLLGKALRKPNYINVWFKTSKQLAVFLGIIPCKCLFNCVEPIDFLDVRTQDFVLRALKLLSVISLEHYI